RAPARTARRRSAALPARRAASARRARSRSAVPRRPRAPAAGRRASRAAPARTASAPPSRAGTAPARSPPRPPPRRRFSGSCPVEPEPDAAHGVDQRRLAELAAQIGDVAVDGVERRLALAAPHLLERSLARDDDARVAQQQLQQLGLAAGQLELLPAAAGDAGVEVEREVCERELLGRRRV